MNSLDELIVLDEFKKELMSNYWIINSFCFKETASWVLKEGRLDWYLMLEEYNVFKNISDEIWIDFLNNLNSNQWILLKEIFKDQELESKVRALKEEKQIKFRSEWIENWWIWSERAKINNCI